MHICVLCTEKCNTGCSHCNFDSKPSGEEMSLDVIKNLRKSILKSDEEVEIVFTGGGEPLMWPDLPKAINLLRDIPRVYFSMVTSGCLDGNDDRFSILKESMEQAHGRIRIEHSFNLFSPSFPKRLEFTLPFILAETAYKNVFVKMVSGLLRDSSENPLFLFDEVKASLEDSLKRILGNDFSKLVLFSAKENHYAPEALDSFLRKECDQSLEGWFETKAFQAPTIYASRQSTSRGSQVISFGHWLSIEGRAKKFFPKSQGLAYYNFGKGLSCSALSKGLELSQNGKFLFCHDQKNFPPIFLGEAGENLQKALKVKKRIANKDLRISRLDITELGDDPCENCTRKAWELHYGYNA